MMSAVPTLDQLARDPSAALGLPSSALAALQAQCAAEQARLAAAQGALAAAMCKMGSSNVREPDPAALEPWMDAEKLAERIPGYTKRWLYRHAATLPFARRLSRKRLVFSLPGAQRYLAVRKA
jgi:hypothetical protein